MYVPYISPVFLSPLTIMFVVAFVLIVIGVFFLVVAVVRMNTRLRYLTYPVYDEVVKEAQKKATDILNTAEEKRRDIITAAEEAATQLLTNKESEFEQFHADYTQQFATLIKKNSDVFKAQGTAISELSERLTEEIKNHTTLVATDLERERKHFDMAASDASEHLVSSFADLEVQAKKEYQILEETVRAHVMEGVEKEIIEAKNIIEIYRKERIALVTRDITNLVAETTSIALGKTLSFEEHRDIILQALEDAKKTGVFSL